MIDRRITIVAVVALLAICAGAISVSAVWDDGDALNAQNDNQAVVQTWTSGDCTCTLYDDGRFIIQGIGAMVDYVLPQDVPWRPYRDQIHTVAIQLTGDLHIGRQAFLDCTSLETVYAQHQGGNPHITIGDSAFKNCTSLTDTSLLLASNRVTSIGPMAFMTCTSLASVTIGNSVTSIGSNAFRGCTSLASVTIPNSITSLDYAIFYNCTSLASVTIPNSVTNIENNVFGNCTSLTSIEFASQTWNITRIGTDAFSLGTSSDPVTCIVVSPNNVADQKLEAYKGDYTTFIYGLLSWTSGDCTCTLDVQTGAFTVSGNGAMADYEQSSDRPWNQYIDRITSLNIGNGVTSIGANTFFNCANLASVSMGNSVQTVGDCALDSCTSLASVSIPNSVTSIGAEAFQNCSSLASVNIGNSVQTIGGRAFQNCSPLASVEIPSSVTSIGEWAFNGCTSLTEITFESITWNITSIGNSAFALGTSSSLVTCTVISPGNVADGRLDAYKGNYTTFHYLSSTSWTSGVCLCTLDLTTGAFTVIGDGEMANYTSSAVPWAQYIDRITSLNIGNGVTKIGSDAFYNCANLASVSLGNTVQDIASTAFEGCSSLTSINFPASVTAISSEAFLGCSQITEITFESDTWNITRIGDDAFKFGGPESPVTCTVISPGNMADGRLDSYGGPYTTFNYRSTDHTVTIRVNNPEYGSVSPASITVPHGTAISYSNNELMVGDNISVATPSEPTAQYIYIFSSWEGVQAEGGTVENDMTVTAVFSVGQQDLHVVTFEVNDLEYGNTSEYQIQVIDGSAVSVSEDTMTIGEEQVVATPAQPTAQYVYAFGDWGTYPQTITADTTINVNFTRTLQTYEVTIQVNESEWGSVSPATATVTVPYGTVISVEGAVLTIGTTQYTAVPTESTAKDIYKFAGWRDIPEQGQITGNLTVTAEFSHELQKYTVTFVTDPQDGSYGTVSIDSIKVDADSVITIDGNNLLIGGTVIATATPEESDIQYKFSLDKWVGVPEGGILADCTITAKFVRTLQQYQVTFKVPDFDKGEVFIDGTTIYKDTAITVDFGTPIRIDGKDIVIGIDAHIASALGVDEYTFINWVGVPVGEKVRGNIEITAVFQQVEIVLSGDSMYCVTGMPAPWMYNPFTVHLNREVMGVWTIKDPNNTGLTIDSATGAFGGVISPGSEYGTATIEVVFTTDEGREVSATFQLYYEPPLIIKG